MTYLLPQQIADLQDMLGQFVAEVFSVSSYEPMPMLRGVYLTSGTQEGTAFDRVMSGIKRFLKIEGVPPVAQVGSTGRSFFLKSLLQEHIFREAALAGSDLRWHQKRRVLQIAGYVLLALVCVAVLFAWLRSYSNNRAYLDQIAGRVPAVDAQIAGAKFSDAADVARLLPVLDALGNLANAGGVDLQHPPLAYRWGLFQGEKIDEAVDTVYRRALEDVLLPIAASRMEAALRDARPDETEYAYAALKAYLMLYDSAHYDPAFVQAVVDLEMERALPPDFSPAERSALRAHLAALFGNRVAVSPYPMNERLVADVRDRLRQVPFSQRLYRQMTMTLRPATSAFDFSVARAVGPDASLVFRRQSGKPLSEGVPGLTRNGYRNVFAPPGRRGRSVRARGGVGAEPRAVRDSRPERRGRVGARYPPALPERLPEDLGRLSRRHQAAAHRDARAEHPGGARAVLRRFAAHAADGGARTRYGARRRTGRGAQSRGARTGQGRRGAQLAVADLRG